MTNVRFLSWAAMVLDRREDVRAEGYRAAPADLSDGRPALARAVEEWGPVGDDAIAFLESHGGKEAREILVAAMLRQAPQRRERLRTAVAEIDGRRHVSDPRVAVPEFVPWSDLPAPALWAERAYDVVGRAIMKGQRSIQVSRRLADERNVPLDTGPGSWCAQQQREIDEYSAVTMEDCDETARAIAGNGVVHPVLRSLARIEYARDLGSGLSTMQRLRLVFDPVHPSVLLWGFDYSGVDLRALVDAAARLGARRPLALIASDYLSARYQYLDRALAWPLFVEHPGPLDDALGLAVPEADTDQAALMSALGLLADMPLIPRRYLPRVVQLATEGKARPCAAARRVVAMHGDPVVVATEALQHRRSGVRASAATWLAELGAESSVAVLEAALAVEKSASARLKMEQAAVRLSGG